MLHIEKSLGSRRRLAAGLAAVAASLLVAACGHHDDDDRGAPPGAQQSPPATSVDAFIAYVQTVVGSVSETAEPAATDSVPVTTPDNTEPVPVQ